MSDPPLPEDISCWPESPFELLGVEPGMGARDMRRAYLRLIRTYKPEQYPEQFRRIREAFEFALHFASANGDVSADSPPAPSTELHSQGEPTRANELPNTLPQSVSEQEGQSFTAPYPTQMPSPDDGASVDAPFLREAKPEELWYEAVRGDVLNVYRQLCEFQQRQPNNSEHCLQLYWLLALHPDLDPTKSPCDWLVHGLAIASLKGPLSELYRREIAENPEEAISERCSRLITYPANSGTLSSFVAWRWEAAALLHRWDVIADDMRSLRERIQSEDEESWLRLLFHAADLLAWTNSDDAWRLRHACAEEIKQLDALAIRLPHAFDRFDYLQSLATDWWTLQRRNDVPVLLTRVVALAWTRPFSEVRPILDALIEAIVHTREAWFNHLDSALAQAPLVLVRLNGILSELETFRGLRHISETDLESSGRAIREFLEEFFHSNYEAVRPLLFNFCLRESISPELVAQFIAECSPGAGVWEELQRCVRADLSLLCVWKAHRLYWA